MELCAALKQIGLKGNEVKVYLTLLEGKDTLASEVSGKAGLNRSQTYDILESLMGKGLAAYSIMNNRKHFHAASPEKLRDYLKEKRKAIDEQEAVLDAVVPILTKFIGKGDESTDVEVYTGKEGLKTIYDQILRECREYFILGATGKVAEILKYYFPHHEKERIRKKIKLRILFNERVRGGSISKQRKHCQIRFLPAQFNSPVPTLIYGSKVAIMVWTAPLGIVVENKEIAETYRSYFSILWKKASME